LTAFYIFIIVKKLMDQETKKEFEYLIEITKKGFDEVDKRFNKIEAEMVTKDYFEKRVGKIEAEMITKDYLDDKLADLRADLVVLTRKEDRKLTQLVKILGSKNVLNQNEVQELLAMEPFSHIDP